MTNDPLPDWDRIVERHSDRVFRVAMRILRSATDAEDVCQDVFVEAFRLHQRGPVQSWTGLFVRMATFRALDRLRRNRPAVALRDSDRISSTSPLDVLEARELAAQLQKALARLPDQQAAVFAMHYFENLSRDQIAASLSVSVESVSTSLYKARQHLQKQLSILERGETK